MKEALALGLGVLTGIRSMTGPAWVIFATQHGALELPPEKLSWTKSDPAMKLAIALAAGEYVADKLPVVPDRTSAIPLLGRLGLGALCGAAVEFSFDRKWHTGAALGTLGALLGAFAGFGYRKYIAERGLPDLPFALLEDGATLTAAYLLYRSQVGRHGAGATMDGHMLEQEARYAAID